MKEYLDFAIEMASYAGDVMREYFYKEDKDTKYKEDRTPVTIADKKINNYLIDMVKERYPSHIVDGEEARSEGTSKYVWVCDPIDGTAMFTRGIPVSTFSLALVIDGVPNVGVVYDPFLDKMYTAIKGEGAFCNGKKIMARDLDYGDLGCSIDCYFWNNAKYDVLPLLKEFVKDARILRTGSVAHGCMLVASGKTDAVIFPGNSHGHCDMAASKLIVDEAGGMVTDFHGREQRYDRDIDGAIATNGKIHDKILEKVKKVI